MQCVDLKVRTGNPGSLARTVDHFSAVLVTDENGNYKQDDGCYFVRCFGNGGFVEFAINKQGYGKVEGKEVVAEA